MAIIGSKRKRKWKTISFFSISMLNPNYDDTILRINMLLFVIHNQTIVHHFRESFSLTAFQLSLWSSKLYAKQANRMHALTINHKIIFWILRWIETRSHFVSDSYCRPNGSIKAKTFANHCSVLNGTECKSC